GAPAVQRHRPEVVPARRAGVVRCDLERRELGRVRRGHHASLTRGARPTSRTSAGIAAVDTAAPMTIGGDATPWNDIRSGAAAAPGHAPHVEHGWSVSTRGCGGGMGVSINGIRIGQRPTVHYID